MVISGICSTGSSRYEYRPSTTRASMTMVANTGWLTLVRVIHMEVRPGRSVASDFGRAGLRFCLAHPRHRAALVVADVGHDDLVAGAQPVADFDECFAFAAWADLHRSADDLLVAQDINI